MQIPIPDKCVLNRDRGACGYGWYYCQYYWQHESFCWTDDAWDDEFNDRAMDEFFHKWDMVATTPPPCFYNLLPPSLGNILGD